MPDEPTLVAGVAGAASRSSGADALALLARDDDERVQLGTTRDNLLAPLRIWPGMRVLELGAGGGALTRALAEAGASVMAVEPDAELADLARARCADLAEVHILVGDGSTLPPEATAFDLVLVAPIPGATGLAAPDGPPLAATLDEAVLRLAPTGLLAVAVDNPWGLAATLEAPGAISQRPRQHPGPLQGAPGHPGLAARATIERLLDAQGLTERRTWGLYPDRVAPRAIVAEELYRDPAAPLLLAAFVRDPVGRPTPGTILLREPSRVLREAVEANLGLDTATSLLVLAGRHPEEVAAVARPGLLFLLPGGEKGQPWRRKRVLDRAPDGAWTLDPMAPVPDAVDGPLRLRERPSPIVLGVNGEDLVMEALLLHGPADARARAVIASWWHAASAIVASPDEGGWHFDVGPRNFIVDAAGVWRFVDRELTMELPVSPAVAAWRAIVFTLADRVLPLGLLPEVDPARTIAELTADLLGPLDVATDASAQAAWVAFESDLQRRVRPAIASAETEAGALRSILARRVGEWAGSVPLDRLLAALRDAEERRATSDAAQAAARAAQAMAQAARAMAEEQRRVAEQAATAADARARVAEAARIAAEDRSRAAEHHAEASDAAARQAATRSSRPEAVRAITALMDRLRRVGRGAANPLFDAAWYLERYPDVRAAGVDPWRHFVRKGAAEGRDPNPWFDTDWYLASYPDVAASGYDPLEHFLRYGLAEGRRPSGRQRRVPEATRPEAS